MFKRRAFFGRFSQAALYFRVPWLTHWWTHWTEYFLNNPIHASACVLRSAVHWHKNNAMRGRSVICRGVTAMVRG